MLWNKTKKHYLEIWPYSDQIYWLIYLSGQCRLSTNQEHFPNNDTFVLWNDFQKGILKFSPFSIEKLDDIRMH